MIKNTITADKSQIKEAFGICKCQYFSHQNQKPKKEVNSTHKNQSDAWVNASIFAKSKAQIVFIEPKSLFKKKYHIIQFKLKIEKIKTATKKCFKTNFWWKKTKVNKNIIIIETIECGKEAKAKAKYKDEIYNFLDFKFSKYSSK